MPIAPENRDRYPPSWRALSDGIRFGRAGSRCECAGECGIDHQAEARLWDNDSTKPEVARPFRRCQAVHGLPHPETGSAVVLTVGHLDHQPENVDPTNLRAWCQRCHNRYDGPHRRANARRTRNAGQGSLEL